MKQILLGLLLSLALACRVTAAAAGLTSIPFTTSQANFTGGDGITIQEVLASAPALVEGTTFIVRGTYTLQSQAAAIMSISLTTTTPILVANQPTARRQITAGSGSFEFEYTIQHPGTVYIAFTPVPSGSSFGRIYFAAGQPTGGGGSTSHLGSVPFATSRAQFAAGDALSVQDVLASSPRMEPGDTVVVRGQYTLQSRADALLALVFSANTGATNEGIGAAARKVITQGSGSFELTYTITQPGALHLSLYPNGVSGSSFGIIYITPPAASGGTSSPVAALNYPAANTGRLGNLSVRTLVSAGDGTLVSGITVTDQERYVLIRGIGPSLAAFGVANPLRKPVLNVHTASGELIATTASWTAAFTGERRSGIELVMRSVGAFPLLAGSEDAVLNLRLVPGGYTVSLSTGDGAAGTALLEVYASSTYSAPAGL